MAVRGQPGASVVIRAQQSHKRVEPTDMGLVKRNGGRLRILRSCEPDPAYPRSLGSRKSEYGELRVLASLSDK